MPGLKLDFLEEAFDAIQEQGKNLLRKDKDPSSAKRKQARKLALTNLKNRLKELAVQVHKKKPHLSLSEAQNEVRKAHVRYLSTATVCKLAKPEGITRDFDFLENHYISTQVPIGEFKNCYWRWETGLPAFRKHTFKDKNDNALIEYYHHSSPVPYEIPDFRERIEATVENFKQVCKETGGEKPVTEIRLLATNSVFAKADYKQAWMTYLGAIRSGQPVSVTFRGFNILRLYTPRFETLINTRYDNDLFEEIFKKLGHQIDDDIQAQIKKIKEKRDVLEDKIRTQELPETEEAAEKWFINLLEEQHQHEKLLEKLYEIEWDKCNPKKSQEKDLVQDVETYLKLRDQQDSVSPKFNGQIQAILVRLNLQLGRTVATGCNDAKDRDGAVSVVVEANEIYKKRYGYYPDIFDAAVRKELKTIQKEVCQKSTPAIVAEEVSFPGWAPGLDNLGQLLSGFGEFPNELGGEYAGSFKKAHHDFYHGKKNNIDNRYELLEDDNVIKTTQKDWSKATKDKGNDLNLDISDNLKADAGKPEEIYLIKTNPDGTLGKHDIYSREKGVDLIDKIDSKEPTSHLIEVYKNKISYQPPSGSDIKDMLEDNLKIIAAEMVEKAMEKFGNNLNFIGCPKLVKIAREIFGVKLAEKLKLSENGNPDATKKVTPSDEITHTELVNNKQLNLPASLCHTGHGLAGIQHHG